MKQSTIAPVDQFVSSYVMERAHAFDGGKPASGLADVTLHLSDTEGGPPISVPLAVDGTEVAGAEDPQKGALYSGPLHASDLAPELADRMGGNVYLVTRIAGAPYSSIQLRVVPAGVSG